LTAIGFFQSSRSLSLGEIATATNAELRFASSGGEVDFPCIAGGASLEEARPGDLTLYENTRYAQGLWKEKTHRERHRALRLRDDKSGGR
jgi:hypothetical protein